MMMSKQPTIIEIEMNELENILRRAEAKQFNDEDYETTRTVFQSYVQLLDLLKSKNVSIRRLQKMLFGSSTEKTAAVSGDGTDSEAGPLDDEDAATDSPGETDSETAPENDSPARGKGHGRNGADAYHGAEKIEVPHESLQPGDACPDCTQGTVYEVSSPGVRGTARRAQLDAGRGDFVHAQALGKVDAVSAGARGAIGQQHR